MAEIHNESGGCPVCGLDHEFSPLGKSEAKANAKAAKAAAAAEAEAGEGDEPELKPEEQSVGDKESRAAGEDVPPAGEFK